MKTEFSEDPSTFQKGDMSKRATGQQDFDWSLTSEPHLTRQKQILKDVSNVRFLEGSDPLLKWKISFAVILQIFLAYYVSGMSWIWVVVLAYTVGGTINHGMTLAMHEVSHNLAFSSNPSMNRYFGFLTNLPLGFPAFSSFQRYHREHHMYQGEDGVDSDIPTYVEGQIFLSNSPTLKTLWVFLQPAFYSIRPFLTMRKVLTKYELMNLTVQLVFNFLVYNFFGIKALFYLVVGTLLGMGLHPMAGHFVAEHYTFLTGQETYSYYGPLNWFSFNVGYHNEHHDFPTIPGSRLPKLRELAPLHYDHLPHHYSWVQVLVEYIMLPFMGPYSRVKRSTLSKDIIDDLWEDAQGKKKN